jgi:hypothetical protein
VVSGSKVRAFARTFPIRVRKSVPTRNDLGVVVLQSNPALSKWVEYARDNKYPMTDCGEYFEILAAC